MSKLEALWIGMGWDGSPEGGEVRYRAPYGANRNHCVHEQKSSLRSGIINGTSLE